MSEVLLVLFAAFFLAATSDFLIQKPALVLASLVWRVCAGWLLQASSGQSQSRE
jgi:hypothetical protein